MDKKDINNIKQINKVDGYTLASNLILFGASNIMKNDNGGLYLASLAVGFIVGYALYYDYTTLK